MCNCLHFTNALTGENFFFVDLGTNFYVPLFQENIKSSDLFIFFYLFRKI